MISLIPYTIRPFFDREGREYDQCDYYAGDCESMHGISSMIKRMNSRRIGNSSSRNHRNLINFHNGDEFAFRAGIPSVFVWCHINGSDDGRNLWRRMIQQDIDYCLACYERGMEFPYEKFYKYNDDLSIE